jgi:hypothetical protein
MLPNIDNPNTLLFQCRCHSSEYLELWLEKDNNDEVYINIIDYTPTLWQCLKWYWKFRKQWRSDIQLERSDMVALRDALIKYTDYEKSDKETLKEEAQGSQAG